MKLSVQVTRDGEPVELTMDTPKVKHVAAVTDKGGANNVELLANLVVVCNGCLDGKEMTVDEFLNLDFSAIGLVEKMLEPFLGGAG